ncbi:MAG: hypothetical protein ACT4O5_05900 [Gammaproteobacteria bacterium]
MPVEDSYIAAIARRHNRTAATGNVSGDPMPIDIDGLTEAELVDLNHRIVERLRFLQQMRAHSRMLEFRIGDRVSFRPDAGPPVAGVITRYNRKTVTLIAEDGRRWNVAPGFLSKVSESESGASGKVIKLRRE